MTGKRSEGKDAGDFHGGVYEAAVNQEKQDNHRSQQDLTVGEDASEEGNNGSKLEVNVALNVSPTAEFYMAVLHKHSYSGVIVLNLGFQGLFTWRNHCLRSNCW